MANVHQVTVGVDIIGGYVSISHDGGRTWRSVIDQVENINFARYLVAHNDRLFAVSNSDRLLQSSDTGRTWSINQVISSESVYAIQVIDNQLYITSEAGFLRSRDTGRTWEVVSNNLFFDFSVLNNQTYIGTALRQIRPFIFDGYRITRNGGTAWENLPLPQGETILQRMVFYKNSVIAQFGNTLYISHDLARTWRKITNIGLPNENISRLTVHNSLLFASFSCKGFYRADLTTVSTREEPVPLPLLASPNPAGDHADLTFTLPHAAETAVRLYSALGTEVWRSESAFLPAGEQRLRMDVRGLPTGVYAYRLTVGGVQSVGRLVVVR
jgi:hypothetical protein